VAARLRAAAFFCHSERLTTRLISGKVTQSNKHGAAKNPTARVTVSETIGYFII